MFWLLPDFAASPAFESLMNLMLLSHGASPPTNARLLHCSFPGFGIPRLWFSFLFWQIDVIFSISISNALRTLSSLEKHTCPALHQHFIHVSVTAFPVSRFHLHLCTTFSSEDCGLPKCNGPCSVHLCPPSGPVYCFSLSLFFCSLFTHRI